MKEVIAKLERILELTSTHGITIQPEGKPATSDDQLMYVESKIRLNAIQALDIFDKNNIEKQKPRTKTEFVKCEFECAWHAIKAFEDGEEIYTKRSHKDFVLIDNAPDVLRFLYDLHRKVETEIDERQEFISTALGITGATSASLACEGFRKLYDSGKFKLVE